MAPFGGKLAQYQLSDPGKKREPFLGKTIFSGAAANQEKAQHMFSALRRALGLLLNRGHLRQCRWPKCPLCSKWILAPKKESRALKGRWGRRIGTTEQLSWRSVSSPGPKHLGPSTGAPFCGSKLPGSPVAIAFSFFHALETPNTDRNSD